MNTSMSRRRAVFGVGAAMVWTFTICPVESDGQPPDVQAVDFAFREMFRSPCTTSPPDPDNCFCLARDGARLWVGTPAGAVQWDLRDSSSRLFRVDQDWNCEYVQQLGITGDRTIPVQLEKASACAQKWFRNSVRRIVVLDRHHVWIETFSAVMVVRGDRQSTFASVEEALSELYRSEARSLLMKAVAIDRNGTMWRTQGVEKTSNYEIRYFDGGAWKVEQQPGPNDAVGGSPIHQIVSDRNGNLWACGSGGIFLRQKDRWNRVEEPQTHYPFFHLITGAEGKLWAFGQDRLARMVGGRWDVFEPYCFAPNVFKVLLRQKCAVETADGTLCCLTGGHSGYDDLIVFDGSRLENTRKLGATSAIAQATNGQLWACSKQALWTRKKGAWTRIPLPYVPSAEPPFEHRYVRDLVVDADGEAFLATHNGLLRRSGEEWEHLMFGKKKRSVDTPHNGG